MLAKKTELDAKSLSPESVHVALRNAAKQPFYNTSRYTFETKLDAPDHLAENLRIYIAGFSEDVRKIFERFKFEAEIETLADTNRLFLILQDFVSDDINLHPDALSSVQMGYAFEELIRRFNEEANEQTGDHFTPREVIKLMAALTYAHDSDVTLGKAVARSVKVSALVLA